MTLKSYYVLKLWYLHSISKRASKHPAKEIYACIVSTQPKRFTPAALRIEACPQDEPWVEVHQSSSMPNKPQSHPCLLVQKRIHALRDTEPLILSAFFSADGSNIGRLLPWPMLAPYFPLFYGLLAFSLCNLRLPLPSPLSLFASFHAYLRLFLLVFGNIEPYLEPRYSCRVCGRSVVSRHFCFKWSACTLWVHSYCTGFDGVRDYILS